MLWPGLRCCRLLSQKTNKQNPHTTSPPMQRERGCDGGHTAPEAHRFICKVLGFVLWGVFWVFLFSFCFVEVVSLCNPGCP